MRRILIAAGVTVLVMIAAAVIIFRLKGPAMLSGFIPTPSAGVMYPTAPAMPLAVTASVEDLLAVHEAFLKAKAPAVLAALQPGLSDAEIDKLEVTYAIKLTSDLRALYRWRNGTPRSVNIQAFPNHEFVPLEVALANRDELRKQIKAGTPEQRKAYTAFAGHRDAWVGLIVDLAGDGHFYDPTRSESEGSFFFCFAEDGSYVFYPAFRNYVAAVVEGEKAGVFVGKPRGVDTADFVKAQALWLRYGEAPKR